MAEIAIIGGGIMGASAAFWLTRDGHAVTVLERDPTLARSATALSASGVRQQFSDPANVALSQVTVEMLRDMERWFGADVARPAFCERGYLYCVTAEHAAEMQRRVTMQRSLGAGTMWLEPDHLAARFPELNTEGLAGGSLGTEGEGWFDGMALHAAFRSAARAQGAVWRQAEVAAIDAVRGRLTLSDGAHLTADLIVNAAGPGAGALAAGAGLDVPVEPRKRHVFVFDCDHGPHDLPLTIDTTGAYVRPEGRGFICGISPAQDGPCDPEDFETDWPLFEEVLWPALAHRIPAFERLRLRTAWTGHYDYNPVDCNALIGPHPDCDRFWLLTGFTGHGLQQAAGAGRGLAERITHGRWRTLDLTPFDPLRMLQDNTGAERAVI